MGLVYVHFIRATRCYLPSSFIDSYSVQRTEFVIIYRLNEVVGAAEDDKSTARYVRLGQNL